MPQSAAECRRLPQSAAEWTKLAQSNCKLSGLVMGADVGGGADQDWFLMPQLRLMSAEINKTIWLLLQLRLSHSKQTGELRCCAVPYYIKPKLWPRVPINNTPTRHRRRCWRVWQLAARSAGARTQFDL